MELEKFIQTLILIHAGFGGIALVSGLFALIAKKGSTIHKKSGIVFFYTMLASAIVALLISFLPNHHSPFLFSIGIFSIYFLLIGYRSLRFKRRNVGSKNEKIISLAMVFVVVGMIVIPLITNGVLNIVLTVFGLTGLIFALRNIKLYQNPEKLQKNWLKLHLGNMIGGYIAAVTAFVVVNEFFPSFYGWFIPGIIGGTFIAYWIRKLNKGNTPKILTN
ncbi:DUF2306 domain-containing protein [Aequorivita antarctica]|uniref:DUF2306 domain-containing protein n=1 Tax=Aequorivita antarctica TaxID=153266 RepID=A0A5C6Z0K2_9FLAO|nr:DUF2306 domain-containing protein [Aequorivita antarctica]TXD73182.1 DUF2306 domain-containing protein [Aequorivita antarctica]SRX74940.1 hypothetical protein AEQU3_01927 [Aequorivita antarctica]